MHSPRLHAVLAAALLAGMGCTVKEAPPDDTSGAVDASGGGSGDGCTESATGAVDAASVAAVEEKDGSLDPEACQALCDSALGKAMDIVSCSVVGDDGGKVVELECVWDIQCPDTAGRGHARVLPRPPSSPAEPLEAWFLRAAHDEAASVHAFRLLHGELRRHGAPADLLDRVRRAQADEGRHARVMRRYCRKFGLTPPKVRTEPGARRSLVDIAVENVVEGCVRESWGAIEAQYQALHARLPGLREAMRTIADEEAEHAALAWDIHAWCLGRLGPAERQRVEGALDEAWSTLLARAGQERPAALRGETGLPEGRVAGRMVEVLREGLRAA